MSNRRHERALMNAATQEATGDVGPMIGKAMEIPMPAVPVEVPTAAPDFEPPSPYIYIKPDNKLERRGNIITPIQGQKHQNTGIVLLSSDPDLCDKGDRVMFAKMFPYECDGMSVFVIRKDDVLGVRKFVPDHLKIAE